MTDEITTPDPEEPTLTPEEATPVAPDEVDAEVSDPAPEVATEVEAPTDDATPAPAAPVPAPPVAVPSPAALARMIPRPPATAPAAPVVHAHSESAAFGRVAEDGTVFVRVGEEEREVGSYPGASSDEALQYFARKYDELAAQVALLSTRVASPEVAAKEVAESVAAARTQVAEAHVVGDIAALEAELDALDAAVTAKRETESAARAAAKEAATIAREAIVTEAEAIAAQIGGSIQWKTTGERMRTLLDDWKSAQRNGPRLDKAVEAALWQRFSHSRNAFDKARRAWFTEMEHTRDGAKRTKEKLVAEAEALASSKDWATTARAFKQLMDQWRTAGRASRAEDDALWERFKAAQDSFFQAKDAVVAAEDEEFRANLAVKEALLVEAQALLPITDLDAAKASLRGIQDRWDKAGKVPRADMERVEKGIRRVESTIRDAEDARWKATNPEVQARASSMVTQLEAAIAKLDAAIAAAQAKGDSRGAEKAQAERDAKATWLEQVRSV